MESWKTVWRKGFVPELSTAALEALREGLRIDDSRLLQGETTLPSPIMCDGDWLVESACAIGFCGWRGDGLSRVDDVHEYFGRLCYNADLRFRDPAASRWFTRWFDDTPRPEMIRELLAEVELAIAGRARESQ